MASPMDGGGPFTQLTRSLNNSMAQWLVGSGGPVDVKPRVDTKDLVS